MTRYLPDRRPVWPPPARRREPPFPTAWLWRRAAAALAAILLASGLAGSLYRVRPDETAEITRRGAVVGTAPVGPGLHAKLPWIDRVARRTAQTATR